MIEQRCAQFQPVRHGAKIRLAQNVLGQIVGPVDLQHLSQRALRFTIRCTPVEQPLQRLSSLKKPPLLGTEARKTQAVRIFPRHLHFGGPFRAAAAGHRGRHRQARQAQTAAPATAQVLPHALVSRQQFIAAFASQHDLDVIRRFLREIPARNAARVGERFVQVGDDAAKIARDILADRDRKVAQFQPVGDLPGLAAFIHRRTRKRSREGVQFAVA